MTAVKDGYGIGYRMGVANRWYIGACEHRNAA